MCTWNLPKRWVRLSKKYFEDDSGLPLTNKKMVHWMCKGFYITCTEMSSMCHGFAYAEENDRWKSWESSDEYLELLTLLFATSGKMLSVLMVGFLIFPHELFVELFSSWFGDIHRLHVGVPQP